MYFKTRPKILYVRVLHYLTKSHTRQVLKNTPGIFFCCYCCLSQWHNLIEAVKAYCLYSFSWVSFVTIIFSIHIFNCDFLNIYTLECLISTQGCHISLWIITTLALSPGHSQTLSHNRGEKSGQHLRSLLRHGPEMVDSVSTNWVHTTH